MSGWIHAPSAGTAPAVPAKPSMENYDMKLLLKAPTWAALLVLSFPSFVMDASAASNSSPPSPSTTMPLLGSWMLDTTRMPMPPAQRPRSVRFSFADAGDNKWNLHVDIVYDHGEQVHSVATASMDGKPAVLEQSPEADTVALKRPAPNVLVMALQKSSVLVSTRIYAVQPDGKTLVETAVYPGNDGVLAMKTNYFTRAP